MRTTLNIDDELLQLASRYTGETKKTKLVRMGLEALVERAAARRLAALGGTDKQAAAGRRMRSAAD
ncbi:MAG: type II toxin-antitoxin system VapB family antitoxin [Candidatus Sumerlaeaceae bacterium]